MVLQVYPARLGNIIIQRFPCRPRNRQVIVNYHAVMNDTHPGIVGLFAGSIETRRQKSNIIALPLHRRCTHINQRSSNLIDTATFIIPPFKGVTIEYLHFVSPLQIYAAVAAGLLSCFGHKRSAKLQMQFKIPELSFCYYRTRPRHDLHCPINELPPHFVFAGFVKVNLLPLCSL